MSTSIEQQLKHTEMIIKNEIASLARIEEQEAEVMFVYQDNEPGKVTFWSSFSEPPNIQDEFVVAVFRITKRNP